MLSGLRERLRLALRGRWLALAVTLILTYFGYHALHGQRGWLAWVDHKRELEAAKQELVRLESERKRLELRVQALQQDGIDRDLLEEELRKLGYVRPNELIILSPPAPGAS